MSPLRWCFVLGVGALLMVALNGRDEDPRTPDRARRKSTASETLTIDGARVSRKAGVVATTPERRAETRPPAQLLLDATYTWTSAGPPPVEGDATEVHGWLTDVTGRPVVGARVVVGASESSTGWRTETDSTGYYRVEAVPRLSTLRVTADAGVLGMVSRAFLASGERTEVSLVLEPTAVLIVRSSAGNGRVVLRNYEQELYVPESERVESRAAPAGVDDDEIVFDFDDPEALSPEEALEETIAEVEARGGRVGPLLNALERSWPMT